MIPLSSSILVYDYPLALCAESLHLLHPMIVRERTRTFDVTAKQGPNAHEQRKMVIGCDALAFV